MVPLEGETEEPGLDAERRGRALGLRGPQIVPYQSLILRSEQGDNGLGGWVGRGTLQINSNTFDLRLTQRADLGREI